MSLILIDQATEEEATGNQAQAEISVKASNQEVTGNQADSNATLHASSNKGKGVLHERATSIKRTKKHYSGHGVYINAKTASSTYNVSIVLPLNFQCMCIIV